MALYLWIALGSACGGVARFALSNWAAGRFGEGFPWGTILVNVSGCLAMGVAVALIGLEGRFAVGASARHFALVGVLGGYTTFSAFSIQSLALMREGEWLRAGGNVFGSVALCLAAVWLGYALASAAASGR